MKRLLEAELIYGRLLPVDEPHLVERYNKALDGFGMRRTALPSFRIDMTGFSPEIADELGDRDYLDPNRVNRRFVIMTPEQVKKAVEEMNKLKVHPREETNNRYLLRRAERLYQELTAEQRHFLSELIDAFEHALSRQDPSEIESSRTMLSRYLDRLEPQGEEDAWNKDNDEPL